MRTDQSRSDKMQMQPVILAACADQLQSFAADSVRALEQWVVLDEAVICMHRASDKDPAASDLESKQQL